MIYSPQRAYAQQAANSGLNYVKEIVGAVFGAGTVELVLDKSGTMAEP